MVGEYAQAGEIQLLRQSPNDASPNVPEAVPAGVIGEYDAEEDGPLAAPGFTEFVANPHHVRPDGVLDASNGRLDFGLLRNCWGKVHPDLILQRSQVRRAGLSESSTEADLKVAGNGVSGRSVIGGWRIGGHLKNSRKRTGRGWVCGSV